VAISNFGLITNIRAIAGSMAWERIEPSPIFTNDPAVMKLLSLDEAVTRLRNETQPADSRESRETT
jgi:hypothetical protein